jgi:hypothetical protein
LSESAARRRPTPVRSWTREEINATDRPTRSGVSARGYREA